MSKLGSWFSRPATAWWLGIIVPMVMVVADPCVFRGSISGNGPALGPAVPGCYCAILLGMAALAFRLRSQRLSAVVAGVLFAAALFAGVLGVVMLPLSIMGTLFVGIGWLGLSPFLTALVIGAQARRAFRDAATEQRAWRCLLGFLAYTAVCLLVQWRVDAAWLRSVLALPPLIRC